MEDGTSSDQFNFKLLEHFWETKSGNFPLWKGSRGSSETQGLTFLSSGVSGISASGARMFSLHHHKIRVPYFRLRAGGEGDHRGWDGWMTSPTQWHEFEQSPAVSEGQGSLACRSPWGHKESDTNYWPNKNDYFTFFLVRVIAYAQLDFWLRKARYKGEKGHFLKNCRNLLCYSVWLEWATAGGLN